MLSNEFKGLLDDMSNCGNLSNEEQRILDCCFENMEEDEWEPTPAVFDRITDIWMEKFNG